MSSRARVDFNFVASKNMFHFGLFSIWYSGTVAPVQIQSAFKNPHNGNKSPKLSFSPQCKTDLCVSNPRDEMSTNYRFQWSGDHCTFASWASLRVLAGEVQNEKNSGKQFHDFTIFSQQNCLKKRSIVGPPQSNFWLLKKKLHDFETKRRLDCITGGEFAKPFSHFSFTTVNKWFKVCGHNFVLDWRFLQKTWEYTHLKSAWQVTFIFVCLCGKKTHFKTASVTRKHFAPLKRVSSK